MRILLFDWYSGGHHELYLAEFARALMPQHTVVAAAPPGGAAAAAAEGAEAIVIEEPFPTTDTSRRFSGERRIALRHEVDLLRRAVRESNADHALHLFADGVLRALVGRSVGTPLTVLLFRPRFYPSASNDQARSPRERMKAFAFEAMVAAWRQSPGAHALLTLDPFAASRWSRRRGAPAFALPEPPIRTELAAPGDRRGAALVGALAGRKGVQQVVEALEHDGRALSLTLAGILYPGYAPILEVLLERLRSAGVEVHLRAGFLDETDYLAVLAQARVALLPYVGHIGMSRVLYEAAAVGTPVVAHEDGLLGHLVRTRRLGVTVDCRDPRALAAAIHGLADDPDAAARYAQPLAAFAEEHTAERFTAVVLGVFDQARTKRPSNWRTRPLARS